MRTVYVIGLPGSGKTTATQGAVDRTSSGMVHLADKPFAHEVHDGHLVLLGRRRDGGFGGTDALSMSANPLGVDFVRDRSGSAGTIVGEGSRFANRRFFTAASMSGGLAVVHLSVPVEVARARAEARASVLRIQPQSVQWWKGQRTMVRNLCIDWAPWLRVIAADQGVDHVVSELERILREAAT